MRYAKIKKTWRVALSICRSHAAILSAIQVYRVYEVCQGIMNTPVHTVCTLDNLEGRGHCDDLGVDLRIILKTNLKK